MICYFRKGLKPSIKVEIEQQDRESIEFEEIVQRAVNAEAKAGLKSSTMVQKSDIHCSRGHRPSYNTSSKVKTQETTVKEPHTEEPRPKEAKSLDSRAPTLPHSDKPTKLTCEKKKRE